MNRGVCSVVVRAIVSGRRHVIYLEETITSNLKNSSAKYHLLDEWLQLAKVTSDQLASTLAIRFAFTRQARLSEPENRTC